jgi:multidrug efflux pump
MREITGALVGIGMVLAAVFVPMAFMAGSIGVIYRQFSATIVSAMALSVMVAIVLTPALCATMLKPVHKGEHPAETGFFDWFNRTFERSSTAYRAGVRGILARGGRFMAVFAALVVVMGVLFARLPSSFLPQEDQGYLLAQVIAPVGATQQRTLQSIEKLEQHFLQGERDALKAVFTVQGFSFAGTGQNNGMAFVNLKDWSERKSPELHSDAVAGRAMGALAQIKDAFAFAFVPPPMPELGVAAGFAFFLKDNGGRGHAALVAARNQLLGDAARSTLLANVRPNGQEDTPQLHVDVDEEKATALGLSIADINETLSAAWGGQYIDDFVDRGRVKRVYVRADAPFRMTPDDFRLWSVRNDQGRMVPFTAFATWRWDYGSPRLERYNGVAAMEINGQGAPGVSTGVAMTEIERIVAGLPAGFGIEWTALSYQEREAGAQTPLLYALSLLIVFLCLAALYESWSIPFAVMLVVPLGIFGSVLAVTMRGLPNDVYFKVGLIAIIGLSAKNAILIIEFARELQEQGKDLIEATLEACRLRFRPILMTSIAFMFGVLPLAISTGAGANSRHAIGTGVIGGMLTATVLAVFLVPVFFVVVRRFFPGHARHHVESHHE